MDSIRKKAGYLEGLIASMKPDENDPAYQLNAGMVSLLSELADRVEVMDELIGELNDYVESIDDDLTELEGDRSGGDMDFGTLDFDMHIDEDHLHVIENRGAAAPERMYIPALCPECKSLFLIDSPGEKYVCPACEKTVKPQRPGRKNTPIARKAED